MRSLASAPNARQVEEAYEYLLTRGDPKYASECVWPNTVATRVTDGQYKCPAESESFWTPLHLKCCLPSSSLETMESKKKRSRDFDLPTQIRESKRVRSSEEIEEPKIPNLNLGILEGPYAAKLYQGYGKQVLLLWDEHEMIRKDKCKFEHTREGGISTPIDDWMDDFIRMNPQLLIDIFLEQRPETKEEKLKRPFSWKRADVSYFGRTIMHFESCARPSFREICPYSNVRIHAVDWRALEALKPAPVFYPYIGLRSSSFEAIVDAMNGLWMQVTRDFKNADELSDALIRRLNSNAIKIEKQWDAAANAAANAAIRKVFQSITSKFTIDSEMISRLAHLIWNWPEIREELTPDNYKTVTKPLLDMIQKIAARDALIMDEYLIARLFRTWNKPEYGRQKGPPVKFAIIYVGGKHADLYDSIFNALGMKVIGQDTSLPWDWDWDEPMSNLRTFRRDQHFKCLHLDKIFSTNPQLTPKKTPYLPYIWKPEIGTFPIILA